ncbi:MAG: nucleoside deaminase [Bacilli bacterium]|nr:nucleoside deaminase [Bacilli bacterium]
MDNKEYFFNRAFEEAEKSLKIGEIPVGAVIVKDGKIISTGYNEKESQNCCLYHAELTAIREASKVLNNWRLIGCDIYVTLEPCEMCASAIKQARISNIFSAISNDDLTIHNNVLNILKKDKSNPQVNLYNDQMVDQGRKILKDFFNSTRNR